MAVGTPFLEYSKSDVEVEFFPNKMIHNYIL